MLSRAQNTHLRGLGWLARQLELHGNEWLGFVNDHGLATRAHYALAFTSHGLAHERLFVHLCHHRHICAHSPAAEQAFQHTAVVYV